MSDIDGAVKLLGGKGSLADERVVILAQSTGGGLELAQALARVFATAGASVHMLGDVADIEVHAQNIATEIEGSSVTGSSVRNTVSDVQSWAKTFNGRERKCKFLINLGLFGHFEDRRQTSDGAEEHFNNNFLIPAALTAALAPSLVNAAPSRVVNVVSPVYDDSGLLLDNLQFEQGGYDPTVAAGQSQTALIMHALELRESLASKGVAVAAMNVGPLECMPYDLDGAEKAPTEQGAALVTWACAAGDARVSGDRLLTPGKGQEAPSHEECVDKELRTKFCREQLSLYSIPTDPTEEMGKEEDDGLFAWLACCGGGR